MKPRFPTTPRGWLALAATVAAALAAALSEGSGYTEAAVTILRAIGLD